MCFLLTVKIVAMRRFLGVLCCLPLAAGDLGELRELLEDGRMFELREALQRSGWNDSETLVYRAITESRFGQEKAGVEDLHRFVATGADPKMRRMAYEELASALVRLGRYGEAARAWGEALGLGGGRNEDRGDTENARALYASLGDVAPQRIEFGAGEVPTEARHNLLGSWNVPVEVNGRRGEWIFDTGANLSTLSESEAKRMGLAVRETSAYVKGSTGKKNRMRLAVAGDLLFGSAHLSNVVFLVLSDDSLHVAPLKVQIAGILGLPVLRALRSVGVSAAGEVRIGAGAGTGEPNMFFDELDPMVEAWHAGHRLEMFLDTGANRSQMYHSFRQALTKDEIGSLRKKQSTRGGAGGVVKETTEVAPTLRLEILGRTVDIANVDLRLKQPGGKQHYRDGVIGMDGLARGFTLDFRSMQLRLE